MAKRFPSQDSLVVDRAAVEYDRETGSLRIILTDEELPSGLALTVPRGGKIEKTLRSLFENEPNSGGASTSATPQQPSVSPPVSSNEQEETEPVKLEPTYQPSSLARTTPLDESIVVDSFGKIPKLDLTQKGQLITFVSPRNATGQSSATVMMGASLARVPEVAQLENKHKIVVVDLDTTRGVLHNMVPPTNEGLMGIYRSGVVNEETVLAHLTYREDLGIYTLPISKEKFNAIDWLGSDFFNRVIEVLRGVFNIVIADVPVLDTTYITQDLLNVSNINIITNVVDRRSEFTTRQWLKERFRFKRIADKATVLISNAPTVQVKGSWEDVKRTHNPISIIGNIPTDTVMFLNAIKQGNLAPLFTNHNAVAEAYSVIAQRLVTS